MRHDMPCAARCARCRLSRYLTEHMEKISLAAMARLAGTNDAAMALLPLLERPPWVRRCGGGALLCAVCRQLQGRFRLRVRCGAHGPQKCHARADKQGCQ